MKKSLFPCLIVGMLFPCFLIHAWGFQVSEQDLAVRFEKRIYEDRGGNLLRYRLLKPKEVRADPETKYPLVLFLHGIGERGEDNEAQLKWGVKNFAGDENMEKYPCFVAAPQCPLDDFWVAALRDLSEPYTMSEQPTEALRMAMEMVGSLQAEFPQIDSSRLYITGLSMGGFGTWDAIQRYPNLFAAAVPVCGGGDISKAKRFSHLPIWVFHGAEDRLVDPKWSREMVLALENAGGHPKYTEYPGVGHQSWIGAYSDPEMFAWLFSQKK